MRGFPRVLHLVVTSALCLGCEPAAEPTPIVATGGPATRAAENPWPHEGKPREWRSIVLHHTATDRGSVEGIHEAHLRRKWLGIGYHFVIGNGAGMPDGRIEATFRWRTQLHGAHAGVNVHNEHGIGIVLVGNFEKRAPTERQLVAVKRLVSILTERYGIAAENVVPHRDVRATVCPGKHFPLDDVLRAAGATDVHLADFNQRGNVR